MTTVQNILSIAKKYIGTTESNGGHKKIIDAYNAHKPLAVGYKVQYNDDWCDTFVSKVAIEAGAVGLIGTECGVERHIAIFKKLGIWNENGATTPKPGDIITYNWGDTTQSNDGFADHIGFVESVNGKTITTIEGNYGNAVKRRTVSVGAGTIRGYARPKYSGSTYSKPVADKPAAKPASQPSKTKYNLPTGVYRYRKNENMRNGNEVLQIQLALSSIYFYPNKGAKNNGCDGWYGLDTANAVKRFQSMHGLTADGDYGDKTRNKLNSLVNK